MDQEALCTICEKPLNDTETVTNVREKGLKAFIEKSHLKKDGKWKIWDGMTLVQFHESCRKRYRGTKTTLKWETATIPSTSSAASTSDTSVHFDFLQLCFLCGRPWKSSSGNLVRYSYMKSRFLEIAQERGDEMGTDVLARLQGVSSIIDVQARYHTKCYSSFVKIPPCNPVQHSWSSRYEDTFASVCEFIETSEKPVFRLSDLVEVMKKDRIANQVLYRLLEEKYQSDIQITHERGKEPLIFYKCNKMSNLCYNWFCDRDSVSDIQRRTILKAAAEILKDEIMETKYETENYPPPSKFLNNVEEEIPPLLTQFLGELISTKGPDIYHRYSDKRNSIAHAIVSALRRKSFVSSLHLAVGVYIYRKTGSRLVIDLLNKLGVCASYYSLQLLEASSIKDPPSISIADGVRVQYVFDNTDHNVATLRGHETFHCMGGIAVYTPEENITSTGGSKKCKTMPPAQELASQKQILSLSYNPFVTNDNVELQDIEFMDTAALDISHSTSLSPTYVTYLWAKYCNVPNLPAWSGYMETISRENTCEVSHVMCLPFINEPCSKPSTIYTALLHARTESSKLNQKTCFVTFDQPLYIKARAIVSQLKYRELKDVTVRLGGFHMLMAYLGAIGYVMGGSGLEDLWSVVYAPQSVKKMLNGHAYSRAVRAHILTFTALGSVICDSIGNEFGYKDFVQEFMVDWDSKHLSESEATGQIKEMTDAFKKKLNDFKQNGPTAALWVQYFDCVLTALQFIEAERLGNWQLHLACVQKMLPLFYASGNIHYAKSAQIYLQDMANLEFTMDENEFKDFAHKGFFTVRRTDKAWAGIWSDMTIEQTLNRFLGTDLKHGRDVTPSVAARYLVAMPSVFSIMESLEEYIGLKSENSEQHVIKEQQKNKEQHVELSNSQMKRDNEDILKFLSWLNEHPPFIVRSSLMSLSTGLVEGHNINCHMAIERGYLGMKTMIGKNLGNISYHKEYKVKNLAVAKCATHIDDENVVAVDSS